MNVTTFRRSFSSLHSVKRVIGNRAAAIGVLIIIVMVLAAVFAPIIAPGDPTDFVARPHLAPSLEHWFGTTGSGQDVFAQTVWGARVSLTVGFLVGIGATFLGALVGMTAGYTGGRTDNGLSLISNVFLVLPSLPLLITLAAFLPSGISTIIAVLIITGWAWPARVLRSQTLALREKDFIYSAEVIGESRRIIIFRELLPNMLSVVAAGAIGSIIYAIGAQAGLEFLGLGDTSTVSWGTNLYWATNNAGLLTGAWWTFVPSGLCIALVAFSFTLINYAIDEVTNPRLRSQRQTASVLKNQSRQVRNSRATPVIRRKANA